MQKPRSQWIDDDENWGLAIKGGEGSGFFGHAGRPGERGGSAPSGSMPKSKMEKESLVAGDRVKGPDNKWRTVELIHGDNIYTTDSQEPIKMRDVGEYEKGGHPKSKSHPGERGGSAPSGSTPESKMEKESLVAGDRVKGPNNKWRTVELIRGDNIYTTDSQEPIKMRDVSEYEKGGTSKVKKLPR